MPLCSGDTFYHGVFSGLVTFHNEKVVSMAGQVSLWHLFPPNLFFTLNSRHKYFILCFPPLQLKVDWYVDHGRYFIKAFFSKRKEEIVNKTHCDIRMCHKLFPFYHTYFGHPIPFHFLIKSVILTLNNIVHSAFLWLKPLEY